MYENNGKTKLALENINLEEIDQAETYILFNKYIGRPISLIDKNTGNSRLFEGTFNEAIEVLQTMLDADDLEIVTKNNILIYARGRLKLVKG